MRYVVKKKKKSETGSEATHLHSSLITTLKHSSAHKVGHLSKH